MAKGVVERFDAQIWVHGDSGVYRYQMLIVDFNDIPTLSAAGRGQVAFWWMMTFNAS